MRGRADCITGGECFSCLKVLSAAESRRVDGVRGDEERLRVCACSRPRLGDLEWPGEREPLRSCARCAVYLHRVVLPQIRPPNATYAHVLARWER